MTLATENDRDRWQQGSLVDLEIGNLSDRGDGVGRWQGRAVFVPDTVSGDRVLVRLLKVKRQYADGKVQELLTASPHRIRPRCIVADKCGGCQWQHVSDEYQQLAKREQIVQALQRIGGFSEPVVGSILSAERSLGYRNKATYPVQAGENGRVRAGYYRKSSHQLVNLNQCPVQDERLDPLLAEVKLDIEQRGWLPYDETSHSGQIRHLSLRIGRRTGEILLTLVVTDANLEGIEAQAQAWQERYSQLMGVCLNVNRDRTNIIFGKQTHCVAGVPYLHETFAGLTLQLRPDTFFQVHTEAAELLLETIRDRLHLQGHETLVDAYCGIGTFTLPLAKSVVRAIGIEVQKESVEQANYNAVLNDIDNVDFYTGTVETLLPQLEERPDVVLLDPPRKGCDRSVLDALLALQPQQIVCVSCKPSTLARDLQYLCQPGGYRLVEVCPADFFPQTAHVECAAFLTRLLT